VCTVCVDWLKGKMTNDEALRALNEMVDDNSSDESWDHYFEATDKIANSKDTKGETD
jgi:hypothetical protein